MTVVPSTARVLLRSAPGWVPIVVVHALIQALLVLGDPVPTTSWGFAGLVAVSAVAMLALVVLVTVVMRRAAGAAGRPRRRLVAWVVLLGVLNAAVAVVFPWVLSATLVAGALPLAAVAAGLPARRGWSLFRRAPLHASVVALGLVVLATLSWPVALLLGFFVTGPVGAAATWCWLGSVLAVVTASWATGMARPAGTVGGPAPRATATGR